MTWTETDLETLKDAIKTGALRVRYADGRDVTYRSLAEMREIYRMIAEEVVGRSPRVSVAKHVRW